MHPSRELNGLARRKAALRRAIALHRAACSSAATEAAAPLAWLDRALDWWRRLSPIAALVAVPLSLRIERAASPRSRLLAAVVRWGPAVFSAFRRAGTAARPR